MGKWQAVGKNDSGVWPCAVPQRYRSAIEKKQRKIEEYRETVRKYRRGKGQKENAKCYII
jgi:hypothetical protein